MTRQEIYLPDSIMELVRKNAYPGESEPATFVRLLKQGALSEDKENWPDWIGSFEGPGDLGINAEKYLGLKPWGPDEKPGESPNEEGSD